MKSTCLARHTFYLARHVFSLSYLCGAFATHVMTKKFKGFLLYVGLIVLFGASMYLIIREGQAHQLVSDSADSTHAPQNLVEGFSVFLALMAEHIHSSFGLLLLQIIIILITCRIVGLLFKRIGQPMVVGEILAGILLGPSVLGRFAPDFSQFLFPRESLGNINLLSQFGLIFFMYTIGMELDVDAIRKKLRETVMISYTCMFFTFFCGLLAAYFIYDRYGREVPFLPFALFIAITMSITAFPVLARIIQERRLTRTHLGTVALAAAANGDVTAWCLLAIVVAISQAGTMLGAVYNILFAAVYLLIMFTIVRPLLRMVGNLYHNPEVIGKPLVMLMFLLLLISSYLTEIAGLHALFGAFVAGLVMPENMRFRKIMTEKVEDVSLIIFLPLFFVSTGLRTEIGLIDSAEMWLVCFGLILVSTIGKFSSAILSARIEKESWKNSFLLGALMNTHGLMELIALTIGYEMHILPPPVFVMLVLMTLASTFMTTPLLSLINFSFRTGERLRLRRTETVGQGPFRVLISFGRAGSAHGGAGGFDPGQDFGQYYHFDSSRFGEGQPFGSGDFRFDDIFSAFGHAGAGRQRQTGPIPGEDQHAELTIDLAAAYTGGERSLSLDMPTLGAGGQMAYERKTLQVKIPKGISEGQQIRLRGQGLPGFNGGANGDLYLKIRFRESDTLYVKNRKDVYQRIDVMPWIAALGGKTAIDTPAGKLNINIPANSRSGQNLRLKGKGIPAKEAGDLYLIINITLPETMSEADRAAWQQLAEHYGVKG